MMHTTEVFKNTRLVYDAPFRAICYNCHWRVAGRTKEGVALEAHKHEKDNSDFSQAGELHAEAYNLITEAFGEVPPTELRHWPQEFMASTLAAWCESQVFLRRASSWRHALAMFVHDANAGLDFNHSVTEFMDDPDLLKKYIRGDHL